MDRINTANNQAQTTPSSSPSRLQSAAAAVGSGYTTTVNAFNDVKIKIFFFIIIALHIVDMLTGYNRIGGQFTWWLLWYLIVALLGAPFLLDDDEGFIRTFVSSKVFIFLGISAISFLLPIIINYLPEAVRANNYFQFLILISAPWMIYLFFTNTHDRMISRIRNWWVVVWIIILLAIVFLSANDINAPAQLQGAYKINPLKVFSNIWDDVSGAFKKTFSRLMGIPVSINSFVSRNLNDSIGRSFSGQVDPYASSDLGVKFTDVRVYGSSFLPGTEVIVWADIQGESFKDEINLALRCYALDGEGRSIDGRINSQYTDANNIKIKMREKISVSCTFPSLPEGSYDVWFDGSFVFETWAYIQYYFAPDELVKNMWSQDLDPAQEAGVPNRPVGIYTGGPIVLGLASEYDQPIPVDHVPADDNTPDRTLPPFGASITNQWADGEVVSVRQITLMVPDDFVLQKCDRDPVPGFGTRALPTPETRVEMPGYHEYTFGNIGVGSNEAVNYGFESVTCFLGFSGDKKQTAASLIGSYDLVMKTFAARTNYIYSIKKSASVRVDDGTY